MTIRCERCLLPLQDGQVHYRARLRLTGEVAGGMADEGGSADTVESLLETASRMSERELMQQVVEEFEFVLCVACRNGLRQDPAGASNVRPGPREQQ